ncbi:MAG: DUF4101 domain-containing protein [Leptolyngbyaceae cyanobacterium SL_7_1]|nr:DUF4101 domain-containing protein [Leptolyngbyaceae cyanobacterium SL_7_1]
MALTLSNNRYQIIRALTHGASASFLAEDLQQVGGGYYAIKRLKLPPVDPQAEQVIQHSFHQRMAALKELATTTDGLVGLRDYFMEGGYLYLVRDWIEGTPLPQSMQQATLWEETDVEVALYQLLELLSEIHDRQSFHGNVKPSNIILSYPHGAPQLVDFNLLPMLVEVPANVPVGAGQSPPIAPIGFNPPERLSGQIFYSSDLYSLGLTMIYLLTGKSPQDLERNPQTGAILWRHLAPQINPKLAHMLEIAISPNRAIAMPPPPKCWRRCRRSFQPIELNRYSSRLELGFDPAARGGGGGDRCRIAGGIFLHQTPTATGSRLHSCTSDRIDCPSRPNVSTASAAPASPSSPTALTEAEATTLVNQWLTAKASIFSPPFDRDLAAQLTTAPLYGDIAETGGAIEWLQQNNARYEFRTSQIVTTEQFTLEGDRALLDVTVSEDRTLYIGDRIDASKTGSSSSRFRYELRWVEGRWKIADYQDLS